VIAQEAPGRARTGKRHVTAAFGRNVKFKRLLKPFKAVFSGGAGGEFRGFAGGAENA